MPASMQPKTRERRTARTVAFTAPSFPGLSMPSPCTARFDSWLGLGPRPCLSSAELNLSKFGRMA